MKEVYMKHSSSVMNKKNDFEDGSKKNYSTLFTLPDF